MDKNRKSTASSISIEFSRCQSVSGQTKVQELWKYLENQDDLKPYQVPRIVVENDKLAEPSGPDTSSSSETSSGTKTSGVKPKQKTPKEKKRSGTGASKLEKYLREDLRLADTVEVSYEELNAEIEDYQQRLLQCGCKEKKCHCQKNKTSPNNRSSFNVPHEPPKLKTTLKTPPKQATNPLQFVKVGPCSLYRTAQEQLQKVQEVKKIKQEIRDDPEDWQSNLDNWKSSRRKRQEHIIERVVEVKKLELEEHDRQRRRSKTFSEMMEERGNRGRKLSISLAVYNEEDANDLSDLGIGTSSGKSSVSGDTHDDTHSGFDP
ncbi:uncharacterized protein LOC106646728 [Copidosoma floridanum]|uniref:uncharacterized protein LOC106646728 n=1 Tax=Copidosoma floridanum TaxID=29053 RepID=UPI0006C94877|nr:uncharacterized protein LOC106646728 [Copidosoma floridanum]